MKDWDDSAIPDCFTKWVVIRIGLAKCIEYICLLRFDNWQLGHCSTKWSWLLQMTQTGDTTGLDGSRVEDCTPLLNYNASSLRTMMSIWHHSQN